MDTITICPLGSECEEIRDNKAYRCRWFITVKGKDPQSEEFIDKRGCAIEFMPLLQIEVAQTNRGQTAALESIRNEAVKRKKQLGGTIMEKSIHV